MASAYGYGAPLLNRAGFSLQELKNAERFLIDLRRQIAVTLLGLILGESVPSHHFSSRRIFLLLRSGSARSHVNVAQVHDNLFLDCVLCYVNFIGALA